jgi:hypothetical protein
MINIYSKECISYDVVNDQFIFTDYEGKKHEFHDKDEAIEYGKDYMTGNLGKEQVKV